MKRIVWVALLLMSLSLGARAQDAVPARTTRVLIDVGCDDVALKSRITSFISREMRSLGDIEITDVNPSYKISVVAISVTLKSGYTAGHAVSTVISRPLGNWSWALSKELTPENRESISSIISDHESLEKHGLFVGSEDGLRSSLEEMIAEFDAQELEPMRRFWNNRKNSKPGT